MVIDKNDQSVMVRKENQKQQRSIELHEETLWHCADGTPADICMQIAAAMVERFYRLQQIEEVSMKCSPGGSTRVSPLCWRSKDNFRNFPWKYNNKTRSNKVPNKHEWSVGITAKITAYVPAARKRGRQCIC